MSKNYHNYATTIHDVAIEPSIEPTNDIVSVNDTPTVDVIEGVVSGAAKLNVRSIPDIDGEVVCVLAKGSKVVIDESMSTNDWVNVYMEAGLEGYCMREYIEIVD